MIRNVLVTGGAGYIGSKITSDLINKNYNVVIIDNLSSGFKRLINNKAIFYKKNISDRQFLKKILIKHNISVVVHCAASLDVNESEKFPKKYYQNNVYNTENLLKSLNSTSVKFLLFSSTCAVYGNTRKVVNEKSKLNPLSVYGKTKLLCENLIKKYSKKFKFKFVILRYFNVAGSDMKNGIGCLKMNNQLIKNLSLSVKNKKYKINIYGADYNTKDGTCVRDYIHLNDISKIHILSLKKLVDSNKSEIYNCGYGVGYTVEEIVKTFEKITKKKFKINYLNRRKGDIEKIFSNIKKIEKKLNFRASKNSLLKIIKSSIEWELLNDK